MVSVRALLLCGAFLGVCLTVFAQEPLFKNSVVSNDLEFIRTDDPSVLKAVNLLKRERKEMPDRRKDVLFADQTAVFRILFKDGITTEIWAHPDFDDAEEVQELVELIAGGLGKLPRLMRAKLSHVILHRGDEIAFGEEKGHFFVLYSENIRQRIRTHDLEETIFHEASHATLEEDHAAHPDWLAAQKNDGAFITDYAAKLPAQEDLPESALFAYTLIKYPGRLPKKIEEGVRERIPHRLRYFEKLFREGP